jgi:glycosyltransferase involved in cell wall biosynthesis
MEFVIPPPAPPKAAWRPPSKPKEPKIEVKSFQHAGDTGDIIYSLPTVRALGGGILYLCRASTNRVRPRELMNAEKAESIASLLRLQPYLKDVRYIETLNPGIQVDLNSMRDGMAHNYEHWRNLARCHLHQFNLKFEEEEKQWLVVDAPIKVEGKPIVVARSPRYHNQDFPWRKVMRKYGNRMIFVGLPEEYDGFKEKIGKVEYYPTVNLLDLARVIAGAELFIGNQSAPRAIAEGLKVNVLIEGCDACPNTHFERHNAIYFYQNEKLKLPDIGKPEDEPLPQIVASGPVEDFTGLGQLFKEICIRLKKRGMDIQVVPRIVSNHITPAPMDMLALIVPNQKPELLVTGWNDLMKEDSMKGGEVVFSMWESTRVHPAVIERINRYAKCVVVPSIWGASVLDACGCNVPVRVVPLGIDTSVFNLDSDPGSSQITFGTAARHLHGKERKGLVAVGNAFQKAFPGRTDVALHYKIHPDCDFQRIEESRIVYNSEFLSWSDMAKWYGECNAYISGSKGEGFGLHLIQAMAVGCCPIACRFGGQSEFFDCGVGRVIDFKLVRATGDYAGMGSWAELDEDSLIEQMRWVYDNPKAARKLGKAASVRASEYPWSRTLDALTNVLKEFGVI